MVVKTEGDERFFFCRPERAEAWLEVARKRGSEGDGRRTVCSSVSMAACHRGESRGAASSARAESECFRFANRKSGLNNNGWAGSWKTAAQQCSPPAPALYTCPARAALLCSTHAPSRGANPAAQRPCLHIVQNAWREHSGWLPRSLRRDARTLRLDTLPRGSSEVCKWAHPRR